MYFWGAKTTHLWIFKIESAQNCFKAPKKINRLPFAQKEIKCWKSYHLCKWMRCGFCGHWESICWISGLKPVEFPRWWTLFWKPEMSERQLTFKCIGAMMLSHSTNTFYYFPLGWVKSQNFFFGFVRKQPFLLTSQIRWNFWNRLRNEVVHWPKKFGQKSRFLAIAGVSVCSAKKN